MFFAGICSEVRKCSEKRWNRSPRVICGRACTTAFRGQCFFQQLVKTGIYQQQLRRVKIVEARVLQTVDFCFRRNDVFVCCPGLMLSSCYKKNMIMSMKAKQLTQLYISLPMLFDKIASGFANHIYTAHLFSNWPTIKN